jgi:hypothetical protein
VPSTGSATSIRESSPEGTTSPAVLAALLTGVVVFLVLGILRPSYWINDDVKIAWLLAGYPGDTGLSPFTVHTNVLIGLLLVPLFRLTGSPNWFAILLEFTNALATAALLYLALSTIRHPRFRMLACLIVVLGLALFILELSYTISAFLASVAGFSLIWASAQRPTPSSAEAISGLAMLALGGLIRLEMLFVASAIAVPPLFLSCARRRRFLLTLLAASFAVLASYAFNRLYARERPDWNAFYAYTQVREQIHDTHRLFNVHGQIRRIGWTPNDQELFARWHFPDRELYSYEHLRYLEDHVSPYSQNYAATLAAWLPGIVGGRNTPYIVLMIGIIICMSGQGLGIRRYLALLGPLPIALAVNAVLAITYKNPDYVQACTLAAGLLLAAPLVGSELEQHLAPAKTGRPRSPAQHLLAVAGLVVLAAGAALALGILLTSARTNAQQREAYSRIRSELQSLERDGILPSNALIISPAHGLPYDWSNPFELDRPVPAYLDTGWITFSPPYAAALNVFDIDSLPDAIVTRDDVFLMTQQDFTPFLSLYYQEHYGLAVGFDAIYQMPNPARWPGVDDIFLYRVLPTG